MTDEPLVQYQKWYDSPARRRGLEGETDYVKLREAFYAGYAARPRPALEPSPNALEYAERPLARYASQRAGVDRNDYRLTNFAPHDGSADYIRQGSVLDMPYTPAEGRLATSGLLQQPVPGLDRREPVHPIDKARHFAEVYGVEPARLKEVPGPEVLERIHEQLKRDGVVNYPADDTNPGLGHTETVWDGDTTMQFGARGPVPTIPGLQEDENAAS